MSSEATIQTLDIHHDATTNNRDKGIDEQSSSFERRFNTLVLPVPSSAEEEVAIVKDPVQDELVWRKYQETVMKERGDWKDLYRACREQE